MAISDERAGKIIAEAAHRQRTCAEQMDDLVQRVDAVERIAEYVRKASANATGQARAAIRVTASRAARRAEMAGTISAEARDAIIAAAGTRFRPILMTTAAMVLGVVPLILATGASAVSRFDIGLIIATGISIGTLFTLFVVPCVYLLIAEDLHKSASEAKR